MGEHRYKEQHHNTGLLGGVLNNFVDTALDILLFLLYFSWWKNVEKKKKKIVCPAPHLFLDPPIHSMDSIEYKIAKKKKGFYRVDGCDWFAVCIKKKLVCEPITWVYWFWCWSFKQGPFM